MSWGTKHDANSFPTFVNDMKSAGYANTLGGTNAGVWGVNPTKASGESTLHTGWVYAERGTGPAVRAEIRAPGTGYTNADTWVAGTANGTIGVDGNGAIISVFITNPGSFTSTNAVPVVITSTAGEDADVVVVPGGRAGRVRREILVATSVMEAANSIYTNMP